MPARRIEELELERELARYQELLAEFDASSPAAVPEDLTSLPSAFQTVQGLSPDALLALFNRMLLREFFRRNVELRQGRRGA